MSKSSATFESIENITQEKIIVPKSRRRARAGICEGISPYSGKYRKSKM